MINKVKQKIKNNKTLVTNFSYLGGLQIFNLLLPLLTYPYLIRVLGKETYGLIVFAQSIVAYLVILVSFGFNIYATKEVSVHRDDSNKLSEIVSSVLINKLLLFMIASIVLVACLQFIPKAENYQLLFYLTLWLCVYEVLFPIWYFQGIEQMKYISIITLISRLLFTVLIFILIQTPNDYILVPMINGIGAMVAGCIALYIVFIKHKIRFRVQTIVVLKKYATNSFHLFLSQAAIKIYIASNKVLVGTFLGMTDLAYYDLAEKIVQLLKMPQAILSQTIFPKVSKEKNKNFIYKMFWGSLGVNVLLWIVLFFIGEYAILLLGGKEMLGTFGVLMLLTLSVPIIGMSNIFGIQLLIPFGYNKQFTSVIVSSMFFYLLCVGVLWLTHWVTLYGFATTTVLTELFVTLYMYYYCKKYQLYGKKI